MASNQPPKHAGDAASTTLIPGGAAVREPKTYLVDANGGDDGDGSIAKPFATIQRAVDCVRPGDTVNIKGGDYHESVKLTRSGLYLGRAVTIQACAGETVTIIPGSSSDGTLAAFDTNGCDHIAVKGIIVRDSPRCGFRVTNSWRVRLENCRTVNSMMSGILIDKSGMVEVVSCEVVNACSRGEETISVKRSQDVLITGCHIHHTGHEGIDVKEGSKHVRVSGNEIDHVERVALYAESWESPTYDIRFENNIVHDCWFGVAAASECGGVLSDVWFVNNLIHDNHGPGMIVGDWGADGFPHPLKDIHFVNNTVVNNGSPTGWGGGMVFQNVEAVNVDVRNNILANNVAGQINVRDNKRPVSWTLQDNLLWGVGENLGEGNTIADPQFVDARNGDFHVQPNSPAVKARCGWSAAPLLSPMPMIDGCTEIRPS